ncbi:hypothetical protein [Oscillibacter sp.]|uniref:hypothetical protein n=1 Tax=Oscillibacter sp. TaxID=1945593 RepID=UPI0028973112|nr:hypothetical protein [Oscillibacter sp.]
MFALAACGNISDSQKVAHDIITAPTVGYMSDDAYSLYPGMLYDIMKLDSDEKMQILDTNGSKLLINVYSNYKEDDPNFLEEGYNAITKKIAIFDLETNTINATYFFQNKYCSDAIFQKNCIVCVILSPGFLTDYKIIKVNDESTQEITMGNCYANEFDDPHLAKLGDASFAYSYSNEGSATNNFGVNIVSLQNKIVHQVSLEDDGKTEHLRTTLQGDGIRYAYYTAIKGKGTIIIGDQTEILYQFELPTSERVYDFCLLDKYILFSMEDVKNDISVQKIIVKDLSGKTITENNCSALFHLESNGIDAALGTDLKYQIYNVQFTDDNIILYKMDFPVEPALFYSLDANKFLLHYNYNSDPENLRCVVLEFIKFT